MVSGIASTPVGTTVVVGGRGCDGDFGCLLQKYGTVMTFGVSSVYHCVRVSG